MSRHAVKLAVLFCLGCAPAWVATRPLPPGACLGICGRGTLHLGSITVPNIVEEVRYCVCPVPGPFANKATPGSTSQPAAATRQATSPASQATADIRPQATPRSNAPTASAE